MTPNLSKPMQKLARINPDDGCEAIVRRLQEAFDGIELHGDGEHAATVLSLTALSRELLRAYGEIRQREKATARHIESLPLEAITAHLKTLDHERRVKLCAEVMGTDDEGPVL